MATLDDYLQIGRDIYDFYRSPEGLGRERIDDAQVWAWLYHWREWGHDIEWIKAAIRTSPEWQARHAGGADVHDPPVDDAPPNGGPIGVAGSIIQVTHERDGNGNIRPRMMSDRANAFLRGGSAFVFCGTDRGPRMFEVDLASGRVEGRGPIGDFGGETEGWYWMRDGTIMLPVGAQLVRYNPFTGGREVALDISDSHPAHDLWQPHSSDDGGTHTATVRRITHDNSRYPYVGTVIARPRAGQRFEPAVGQLDESQPTRLATHVVIKQNGEDNRIIDLASGDAWDLADADGAIGHSDCGPDFIVGEANLPGPGRCVKLDLRTRQRATLFETDNMGYVSVRGGLCLHSDDTHLSLVSLKGAGRVTLIPHGAQGLENYDNRPKANLDPSARVACYMSNPQGRRDVFLYVLT